MKKIMVIYLFLFACIINYAETVTEQALSLSISSKEQKKLKNEGKVKLDIQSEKEKEADNMQLAMIYFENGEYEKSFEELKKTNEEKRDFDYYYILGKINQKKDEKTEAVKNLKKAEELKYDNIDVKIALYELYSEQGGFEKESLQKKKEIMESNISSEEKAEFKKLTEKYEEKYKREFMGEAYTGVVFDDNVKKSKNDKESDGAVVNGIMGATVIKYGKLKKLYIAGAYNNKIYFSESSNSSHDFIVTAEPVKKYNKWMISAPTAAMCAIENSEFQEGELITGIKGSRKTGKRSEVITGADVGYRNNSQNSYKGFELYPYCMFKWRRRYKINYEMELKLKDEIYNKNEYKNSGIGLKLKSFRVIKEKYKLECKYGINYNSFDFKIAGKKKNELKNSFNIEMEAPFVKESWKYILGYKNEHNNSNINLYDFSKNELYVKIKKEF